jgi:uncharacterized protein
MMRDRSSSFRLGIGLLSCAVIVSSASADELRGIIKSIDPRTKSIVVTKEGSSLETRISTHPSTRFKGLGDEAMEFSALRKGQRVTITHRDVQDASSIVLTKPESTKHLTIVEEFWHNFTHNLFKPLLLFFYLGFLFPILKVEFEFPYTIYQGLTIYLLIAIGWHGGEELSALPPSTLKHAVGFMVVGFCLNFVIGMLAYLALNAFTTMRKVDKATVAGYYGSDSAGTFVTCLGVLATAKIAYDAYMPVMLAVMEIPGCLVALYLVSKLRHQGMDALGNMPDEPGYDPTAQLIVSESEARVGRTKSQAIELEKELALEKKEHNNNFEAPRPTRVFTAKMLHEVFLNPGLCLLFGGIIIGFVGGLQGPEVTRADDNFFIVLFQGVLCLFLLEMGMTASRKLRDLKTAGLGFILFGLIAPNVFATIGIAVAHTYAVLTHTHFLPGTYVLFAVLCGAASYIAVPAVQRLAIPEASPTLPLAASLGLTFSYNVTIGIPVYIEIANLVQRWFKV